MRNSNSPGPPHYAPFSYGGIGWIPVVGDWDGNGTTTVGAFDPRSAEFYLRNSNSSGAPDIGPFIYGGAGWIPVVGDWDADGTTTVGVVDPTSATWYLRNSNSQGNPDIAPFAYGGPNWIYVAGDWDSDGRTSIGTIQPLSSTWALKNSITRGPPDIASFAYGSKGWMAVGVSACNGVVTFYQQIAEIRSGLEYVQTWRPLVAISLPDTLSADVNAILAGTNLSFDQFARGIGVDVTPLEVGLASGSISATQIAALRDRVVSSQSAIGIVAAFTAGIAGLATHMSEFMNRCRAAGVYTDRLGETFEQYRARCEAAGVPW